MGDHNISAIPCQNPFACLAIKGKPLNDFYKKNCSENGWHSKTFNKLFVLYSSKSVGIEYSCSYTETKYLGVLIDQHLSWKPHIDFVSKKISKSVGIIAKARFYLSSQTLMTLYYSLVYPFLTYCNVAWSSTYCSNLNCIYLLQKRLVRLITKAHYLARKEYDLCRSPYQMETYSLG